MRRGAASGEPEAIEALAGIGRYLGAGIASFVNVFEPEVVVVGGGFGEAGELLLGPAREVVAIEGLEPARDTVRIVEAQLGVEAGVIGAGMVAFEALGVVELVPLAVCATPIGNLEDVTLRVLRELAEADVVLAEDTRHTRGLLERHGIRARLLSYHEHNEAKRTAELLPRLQAGERVALVSDAGLPGINDPGARLVAAALEAGVPVTVLPGPSAVETALVASGLVGERYQFLGYLPRGERALRRAREGLARLALAGGGVRVAPASAALAGGPRARGARAAVRRVPRADEAARGGRTRDGRRSWPSGSPSR